MSEFVSILNATQTAAMNALENTYSNILIMGQAGTGKSTFVNYLRSASKKRIICACPTAVSALNIAGQTIHSMFQIQPRDFVMPEFLKLKAKTRNILTGADVLIIDEISMVAPDLLDAMDILARQARRNNAPFGGLQVLAIGDLFQLPPVITRDAAGLYAQNYGYENAYFFDSNVFKRAGFIKYDFDLVYRQNDTALLENLTRLRAGDTNALAFFNDCRIDDAARRENAVLITPFRAVAERINVVGHGERSKRLATAKRKIAYIRHRLGNVKALERGTVCKRLIADCRKIAVGKIEFFQRRATVKRAVVNLAD